MQLGRRKWGYVFILPSMLIFAIFWWWPMIHVVWLSLHEWNILSPNKPFLGLGNYLVALQHDPRFWNAFRNTMYYTVGVVPISMLISLLLALAMNTKLRALIFFRGVYFLPVITSMTIVAIMWRCLLDPDIGVLSHIFRKVGLPVHPWLRDTHWAMPAIIAVSIWKWLGFYMVIFLAGLQGIPSEYYEAAQIDGANAWSRFRYVTLPLLAPTTFFVFIIVTISSFQVFDQVYVMTQGGPLFSTETLVYYIYYQGFPLLKMGYASAIACILLAITLLFTFFQFKQFKGFIRW